MQQHSTLARPLPPTPPIRGCCALPRGLVLRRSACQSLSFWTRSRGTWALSHDEDQSSFTVSETGDEGDDPNASTSEVGDLLLRDEEEERAADRALHSVKDFVDAVGNKQQAGGAKLHDFCLGIPYGGLLVAIGVTLFILTGSASAVQLGLLLGGLLLTLSVSSMNAWKKGKSSLSYIQGQAAIALVIFVVELQKAYQTGSLTVLVAALGSGAMFGFYCYVFVSGGNPPPKKVKPVP